MPAWSFPSRRSIESQRERLPSINRAPGGLGGITAASAIGAALDLIAQYEHERSGQ